MYIALFVHDSIQAYNFLPLGFVTMLQSELHNKCTTCSRCCTSSDNIRLFDDCIFGLSAIFFSLQKEPSNDAMLMFLDMTFHMENVL